MKLVKTNKKFNDRCIYEVELHGITYTVKWVGTYWDILGKNNKHIGYQSKIKEVELFFDKLNKEYLEMQEEIKDGGWVCPNGCVIDKVETHYSETVYGTKTYYLTDQNFDEAVDYETDDSDNHNDDHEPTCPRCASNCVWQEPVNSVKYIKNL
jgi:hypothetical protein